MARANNNMVTVAINGMQFMVGAAPQVKANAAEKKDRRPRRVPGFSIADRIRYVRLRSGLNLTQAYALMDDKILAMSTLLNYESGKTLPSMKALEIIAEAYGVKPENLTTKDELREAKMRPARNLGKHRTRKNESDPVTAELDKFWYIPCDRKHRNELFMLSGWAQFNAYKNAPVAENSVLEIYMPEEMCEVSRKNLGLEGRFVKFSK